MGRVAALLVACLATAAGCGRGDPAKPAHRDALAAARDAPAVELPARPLGLAELADFAWRKGPGEPAFRVARAAEDQEDWAAVVAAGRKALADGPGHLDAAWLLAVGLARTGKLDEVAAPLAVAVSGDFGKWATASLEQPAFQPFLATAQGQAWRRRVEVDRQAFVAALARGVIVSAGGDLYMYDRAGPRWYRLTRTAGEVVGALAIGQAHQLAYVTRERRGRGAKQPLHVGLGTVDLARGATRRPSALGGAGTVRVAYKRRAPGGFVVRVGEGPWQALDDAGQLVALPAAMHVGYPANLEDQAWLDVTGHTARLHHPPKGSIQADWDDQDLASAMRLVKSGRVVAVPSPGLIDGNTVAWSPDLAQLAFVAQLDDHCSPSGTALPGAIAAAAFVADAATGTITELERARGGLAVEWLADRSLAVAGDHGVSIIELGGAAPVTLAGADGLALPRRKPRCTPEPADDPSVDEQPVETRVGDEPTDAGVAADAHLP